MSRKIEGTATWTWHEEAGGAWYVALDGRAVPPYLRQITVEAIVDVGSDGRVAGIKIIDALPPPPEGRVVSAAPDDLARLILECRRVADLHHYNEVWLAADAIEALQRQLPEARAAQSELVDLVKQAVAPLSDEIEDLTRQLSASRAAEERMRALLERVLAANIARGCAPEHARIGLIYDIHAALSPPAAETPKAEEDGA